MAHEKVASVAFNIAGTGLDLERLSEELQLEPSHVHRVGEPNIIGQPFPHDMWQFKTEVDEDESLDTHLRWLAAKLEPHYDYLRSLKSVADVSVYCGVNCDSDQCGFSLSSEALTMFTELRIQMELTILF